MAFQLEKGGSFKESPFFIGVIILFYFSMKNLFTHSILKYRPLNAEQEKNLLVLAFLLLLTLIVYIPATYASFIWDDDVLIINNPLLRIVRGLGLIWTEPGIMFQYYPLTQTTFWLEFQLWGLDPLGYHLMNILLHGLNSILIWMILKKISKRGALFAAIIFAVHPVHVESVAWISERKNVLSGFFYLLSLLAALDYWQVIKSGRKFVFGSYWFSFLCYVCALHCKTVTCTLPLIIMFFIWHKKNKVDLKTFFQLIPFFIIGLMSGLLTAYLEKHQVGAVGEGWNLSIFEKIVVAGKALWFYLGKLIWPVDLVFIYPRWVINPSSIFSYIYIASFIMLLIVLWYFKSRFTKLPLIAFLYFLITLWPALGFFNVYPAQYSFVADHFQYLASIGPIALFSFLLSKLFGEYLIPKFKATKTLLSISVISLLGFLTWNQCYAYMDLNALWNDVLSKNQSSWMAYMNYGTEMALENKRQLALEYLKKASELNPKSAIPYFNIGNINFLNQEYQEAFLHYKKALEKEDIPGIRKSYIYNNIGMLFLRENKYQEALSHFYQALYLNPRNDMAAENIRTLLNDPKSESFLLDGFPEILNFDQSKLIDSSKND